MANYYISPTGNDSTGNGSLASPWATVAKADASVTSADTVNLAAGTYAWANMNFLSGATFQGPPIASGASPTAILDAGGAYSGGTFDQIESDITFKNITFQNLSLTNASGYPRNFVFYLNGLGITLTFVSCIFKTITIVNGIGGQPNACLFYLGDQNNQTVSLTACLVDKLTNGNVAYEIAVFGSDAGFNPTTMNVNLNYCTIVCANDKIPMVFIMNNPSSGLPYILNMAGKNNIFYAAVSQAWQIIFNSAGQVQNYNLTYSDFYQFTSPPSSGAGDITADPVFVDYSTSNYNLQSTSPCLDTGSL